jgi:DNA-binding GntR family transcriptional regulator
MVRTLVEQVHRELRDRVLAGRWRLGERLFEEVIAAELAVSRAPVREAIRMLEQEGLIERLPHRGLFVANPSPEAIVQTAAARALLEVSAVRWGRPHGEAEVASLFACADAMDAAAAEGDVLAAVNQDIRFHGIVVGVCPNAVLLKHYHELDGHMALFLHALSDGRPERVAAMGERHRRIARALPRRDALEREIVDHYRTASRALAECADRDAEPADWPDTWR